MASVGERLSRTRKRAFIGREEQLARFGQALDGDPGAPFAFYVLGPGGIGKSALLRCLADRARASGRPLVELDGRFVSRDPADFERAAAAFLDVPGTVMILDSFEHCQWLESWLWQRFLPRAADDALVVLAGRLAPQPQWTADPAWAGLLDVTELGPFSEEQARSLLAAARVLPGLRERVLRFAGGNPLALSLAAAGAATWNGDDLWAPSADTLRTLLVGLIGEVPTAAHRRALEVAAQAYSTSEELLAALLPDQDAHLLFGWLRDLPFMEATHRGLHPHDAARETLAADLRWRAPNGFLTMRQRLAEEYLRLLREAPEEQVWTVTDELFHLFRDGEMVARTRSTRSREEEVHDRPLHPDDLPVLLGMATETEGPASAEIVRYWAERQPQAFSVYRLVSTGRIVAFTARLALPAPPDPEDLATDPVVAAAWAYTDATDPVRPGEHIGVSRFTVYPERYQVPSRVIDLSSSRAQAESARARGRAYGFAAWRDAEAWAARVKGSLLDTGARPRVGDHTYGVFGVDWRQVPVESWLRHFIASTAVPAPSGPSGFSRTAFDQAVREALAHWRDPGTFAVCALMRARLAADLTDPVEELRTLLRRSVDDLARDPRGERAREALTAGYFSGAPTQEAAARRLSLPYGTYRRHLRQGMDLLCEALWQQELHGPR
ncbi:ATP-binding protein [Kitasatospora camelliae]|uniref:ATP-binding protein n=1 Tax=Kitasatospora camelliae TaxID=3156397 RepID=A0AAU8K8K6_9ACTN